MRGARLICILLSTRPKYRGWFAAVWQRHLPVQIACEVQRGDSGERAVGKIRSWRDGRSVKYSIETSLVEMSSRALHEWTNSQLSFRCRPSRRFRGWGEDLQAKHSNASRRRQSCALFGYDSCACYTALLKLMPDDVRRPARLQGRDGAEDARTTHPCIRR